MALVRRSAACLRNSLNLQHIRTFVPTLEHEALRENLIKLIDKEINPRCPQWEKEKWFPAKEVFKILGLSASASHFYDINFTSRISFLH